MADSDFQTEPIAPENLMNESMISTSSSFKRARSPVTSDSTPTNTSGVTRRKQRDLRPSPQDSSTDLDMAQEDHDKVGTAIRSDIEMAPTHRNHDEYRTTSTSTTETPSSDNLMSQESEAHTGEVEQPNQAQADPATNAHKPIFRPPKLG